MPEAKQVTCIKRRSGAAGPFDMVEEIGGSDGGNAWSLPEADAIQDIETGATVFFIRLGLHTATLVVANEGGRKYLKTAADGTTPEKLLRMPAC
jgi:hypothetical protein